MLRSWILQQALSRRHRSSRATIFICLANVRTDLSCIAFATRSVAGKIRIDALAAPA